MLNLSLHLAYFTRSATFIWFPWVIFAFYCHYSFILLNMAVCYYVSFFWGKIKKGRDEERKTVARISPSRSDWSISFTRLWLADSVTRHALKLDVRSCHEPIPKELRSAQHLEFILEFYFYIFIFTRRFLMLYHPDSFMHARFRILELLSWS